MTTYGCGLYAPSPKRWRPSRRAALAGEWRVGDLQPAGILVAVLDRVPKIGTVYFQIRAKDGSDTDRKKHARSVPKNMGRSGPYKKHRVLVGVAFVAAARFLGGQRFVLSRTKTIHYPQRKPRHP